MRKQQNNWSEAIICILVGFTLGFLACHKLYTGFESKTEVMK